MVIWEVDIDCPDIMSGRRGITKALGSMLSVILSGYMGTSLTSLSSTEQRDLSALVQGICRCASKNLQVESGHWAIAALRILQDLGIILSRVLILSL